jgi:predicted acylesterase/phospholipase RssA
LNSKLTNFHRFVCVTRAHSSKSDLLRSYEAKHPSQRNYDCCLWEAARATTAAPIFFKQISLQNGGYTFVDGGLRLNNPVFELVQEADRVYGARAIGCTLSLGTGWTSAPSLDNAKLHRVLKACVNISTDSEDTAQKFLDDKRGMELREHRKYFRFNVEQGMQDIELNEWQHLEKMDAMTTAYLRRPEKAIEIQRCAEILLNPTPISRTSRA